MQPISHRTQTSRSNRKRQDSATGYGRILIKETIGTCAENRLVPIREVSESRCWYGQNTDTGNDRILFRDRLFLMPEAAESYYRNLSDFFVLFRYFLNVSDKRK